MDLTFSFGERTPASLLANQQEQFATARSAARIIADCYKKAAYGENEGMPPRPVLNGAEEAAANQAVRVMYRILEGHDQLPPPDGHETAELYGRTALKIFLGEMAGFYTQNPDLAHRRLPVNTLPTLNDTMGQLEWLRDRLAPTFPEVDAFFANAYSEADRMAKNYKARLAKTPAARSLTGPG